MADAERTKYADTSTVIDYSNKLNERSLDFCTNRITGRYPMEGYCSNTEVDELCFVLDGSGAIFKFSSEPINFEKGDVIFISKGDIYYWLGNFKAALICTPAWSKEQCKLYSEADLK